MSSLSLPSPSFATLRAMRELERGDVVRTSYGVAFSLRASNLFHVNRSDGCMMGFPTADLALSALRAHCVPSFVRARAYFVKSL